MADEPATEPTTTEAEGATGMSVEEAARVGAETAAAKDDPEKSVEIEDQREAAGLPRQEMTGGSNAPSPIEAEMAQAARMLELARMAENQAEAAAGAEQAQASSPGTPAPGSGSTPSTSSTSTSSTSSSSPPPPPPSTTYPSSSSSSGSA